MLNICKLNILNTAVFSSLSAQCDYCEVSQLNGIKFSGQRYKKPKLTHFLRHCSLLIPRKTSEILWWIVMNISEPIMVGDGVVVNQLWQRGWCTNSCQQMMVDQSQLVTDGGRKVTTDVGWRQTNPSGGVRSIMTEVNDDGLCWILGISGSVQESSYMKNSNLKIFLSFIIFELLALKISLSVIPSSWLLENLF